VSLTAKGPGFYKDFLVVLLLKLFRKKIVYHFHNRGVSTKQDDRFNDFLYQITFKGTKSILLSELLYSDIKKYVTADDAFFCANGIPEVSDEYRMDNCSGGLPLKKACRLLFLSNMIVEKGVYQLLEACKLLRKKAIDFECHFVGTWSEITEGQLQTSIATSNLSNVVFTHGRQLGKEKYALLKSADIFVFPTFYHNECFPLVNLEAMQFSLPIVTTSVGGIPDMVLDGETGFVIAPNDPVALAEKLELLISKPELRLKMGNAGRKRFERFFTMRQFEQNMVNILETVISKQKSTSKELQ
jgi:glycosyltransferase involved in cell wall biosynthesis